MRGKFFGWQSLVLFVISLLLMLLFTRMIIGPVNSVERMIKRYKKGDRSVILDRAETYRQHQHRGSLANGMRLIL
ncbi:MAG: hypothetical protein ACR5LD_12360 [Symbiopectobacterium sp.]